ncbi:MAG: hypothetical protein DRQ24_10115 [Candidatus Latescibacterota bacterium]|nr:MAG: hypothetical protein DRQ24_10115 [Candidatus Latescibacterota bacterium]
MEKRRNIFIDKNFQSKFILKFCTVVIIASLLIAALLLFFSRNSTTVAIENTKVIVKRTSDFIFPVVVETVLIVAIFSSISVIIITLFASHKISGPLYRLKREIEALGKGNFKRNFNIRGNDQLQELAHALQEMCSSLRDKNLRLKEYNKKLKEYVESNLSANDKALLFKTINEMEKELNNLDL